MNRSSLPTPESSWQTLEAAFAALGRIVLLLDEDFRVLRVSASAGQTYCADPGRMIGQPIEEILGGPTSRSADSPWRQLGAGEREEGRRAFFHCANLGARLVSMSSAQVPPKMRAQLGLDAHYLLVLRPADDPNSLAPKPGHGIVAKSPAMLQIVHLIEALHQSDATVLITGETGTGKEVVARAIHEHSPHRRGRFVAVNCAALPHDLLESELFGHVKGSFTGATRDRVGRFDYAKDGTLFLDEIGDLPMPLQAKLLRVLQERRFERVGESHSRPLHARVIAATNLDLEAAVKRGDFREDLYYRLRVVPIHVPPLRARPEDVEALTRYFLARLGRQHGRAVRVGDDARDALLTHAWPGNVRELENAIEYALTFCRGQTLHREHLPVELQRGGDRSEVPSTPKSPAAADEAERTPPAVLPPATTPTLAEMERAELVRELERAHWNRGKAARALGISRTTLWRRLKRLGLEPA